MPHQEPRLAFTGLVFLTAMVCGFALRAAEQAAGDAHDQLIVVSHNWKNGSAETDSLVYLSVTDGTVEWDRIVAGGNLHVGWRVLAARAEMLYALKIDRLEAIDLFDGTRVVLQRRLHKHLVDSANGRIFCLHSKDEGTHLRVYDCRSHSFRDRALKIPLQPWGSRIAASPDGSRLLIVGRREGVEAHLAVTLFVYDLTAAKLTTLTDAVAAPPSMTASIMQPMEIGWIDNHTVAFIASRLGAPEAPPQQTGNIVVFELSTAKSRVFVADVRRAAIRDLGLLPGSSHQEARLLRPCATAPLYVFHRTSMGARRFLQSLQRIDAAAGKLVAAPFEVGACRLALAAPTAALSAAGKTIATWPENGHPLWRWGWGDHRLAFAPDGKRVAWQDRESRTLAIHDLDHGRLKLPAELNVAATPFWARASEVLSHPTPVPDGWTPVRELIDTVEQEHERRRRPDTRKPVAEHLAMTVSVDRKTVALHDPVRVTFTLRNLGNETLKVLKPWVLAIFLPSNPPMVLNSLSSV